ncbi:hypothetical protein MNBD_NITROSPINAE02-1152 [hydrothermal vent metagenome]|uniref:Radical SAM core domain-containing protein n=1 Tax=hydrothermal vent metagenome TaxID=652676 RepID=A0A3B1C4I5_9ZZZZ
MSSIKKKLNLLLGLISGEKAYTGPAYVSVDVTHRCNLKCLCCRYHSPVIEEPYNRESQVTDIPFDLFEKLCAALKLLDTDLIIFEGGGEPLLHPRVFDMISTAKRADMDVMLYTNGVLLNEKIIKKIVDSGLDHLKISLWAGSKEEYILNYPENDPDNFDRVVHGLETLQSFRKVKKGKFPYVCLCHPINVNNFQNIDPIVHLAESAGCDALFLSPLITLDESIKQFALAKDEERLISKSLRGVMKRLDSLSVSHNIRQTLLNYNINNSSGALPCYIGWYYVRVKADGEILFCSRCDLVMGDLNKNDFGEIWNGAKYSKIRKQLRTREGLKNITECEHCVNCCHMMNNKRIHNIFKWFAPFSRQPGI